MSEFLAFAMVGFFAQIIDGALGMGFGVLSSGILLAQGISPQLVSASVNAAKLPTTGTAALSHIYHGNVDWAIVRQVALFGVIGGVAGSLLLTSLKGHLLQTLVNLYLILMGTLIVWQGLKDVAPRIIPARFTRLIGLSGGVIEGIGGSWGPIVTTSLLKAGAQSRFAIGSSNFSEFVVSVAVVAAFMVWYATGHWDAGREWHTVLWPVAGLVAGGLPAAVIGGYLSKRTPKRLLTIAVGGLALGIAAYRILFV